jgi:hypothetical protein
MSWLETIPGLNQLMGSQSSPSIKLTLTDIDGIGSESWNSTPEAVCKTKTINKHSLLLKYGKNGIKDYLYQ